MAIQERFPAANSGDELCALLPFAMPLGGGVPLKPRPGMSGSFELDLKLFEDTPAFTWNDLPKLPTHGEPCTLTAAVEPLNLPCPPRRSRRGGEPVGMRPPVRAVGPVSPPRDGRGRCALDLGDAVVVVVLVSVYFVYFGFICIGLHLCLRVGHTSPCAFIVW